jgi:hypothetical protein
MLYMYKALRDLRAARDINAAPGGRNFEMEGTTRATARPSIFFFARRDHSARIARPR